MSEELFDLVRHALAPLGLELVDLELRSGVARVTVDRLGGADLESLAGASRVVSTLLDEHDPFPGSRYSLEVTSPGVERPLRRPEHFARAVGEKVSIRTLPGSSERRLQGTLVTADADGVVVSGPELPGGSRRLSYDEIERARTVFEWGAGAKALPASERGKRRDDRARNTPGRADEKVTTRS